jgi:hypothetical protein
MPSSPEDQGVIGSSPLLSMIGRRSTLSLIAILVGLLLVGAVMFAMSRLSMFNMFQTGVPTTQTSLDTGSGVYTISTSTWPSNAYPLGDTSSSQQHATSTYITQKGGVYYYSDSSNGSKQELLPNADAMTFQVICASNDGSATYGKDNASVFYNDQPITGADPNTFKLLSGLDLYDVQCSDYAKDKNRVYLGGTSISTHPDSFGQVPNSYLVTDGRSVFDPWGATLSDDAAHFIVLDLLAGTPGADSLYAKDSRSFYISSHQSAEVDKVPDSDPATFHYITAGNATTSLYAADKNLLYYFGEDTYPGDFNEINMSQRGINPSTLRLAPREGGGAATDAIEDTSHVYIGDFNMVQDADVPTFVVLPVNICNVNVACEVGDSGYAKDKDHVYFGEFGTIDVIPGADPSSFVALGVVQTPNSFDFFAKDKNHVYFDSTPIPGADPVTFTVLSSEQSCGTGCTFEAQDANHKYEQGQVVQ